MKLTAMRGRRSCRTYSKRQIEPEKATILREFLKTNTSGPFGAKLRFELLDFAVMPPKDIRACGTYGVIRGASHFIVGAVEKAKGAMEDYGYGMERNVLEAQSLGLATCWLGGTFSKSGFSSALNLKENEYLPAVTPVGYAAARRSIVDSVFRLGAGSDRRKTWDKLFFDSDFQPMTEEAAAYYKESLECVRIAPSAANRQPWRVIKDKNGAFHFYLERSPGYAGIYGEVKLQNVDMGIAMCHFELCSSALGLRGNWAFDDAGLPLKGREYIATWRPAQPFRADA